MSGDSFECRICGNSRGNRTVHAKEMMYGTRESFAYVECHACGCLQIAEVPADIGRHYAGGDYYSMASRAGVGGGALKRWLRRARAAHLFGGGSFVGTVVTFLAGKPAHARWFHQAGAGLDSAVLDVGCGSGELLHLLRIEGFKHLRGIDPFLERDTLACEAPFIDRTPLDRLEGTFDLVMMHHSLEHMPDQPAALRHARRLLKASGTLLVRIPLTGRWAWRTYGVQWVQLDAPRHLVLHSRESFGLLARTAGFEIVATVDDSTDFQVIGSEQYRRGIPLRASPAAGGPRPFTRRELRDFRRLARALNEVGDGDQACFWLRPLAR